MVAHRKYNNTITYLDGLKFDSAWEAECWAELTLHQRVGTISELRRQVRMPLNCEGGKTVCFIIPDFAYRDAAGKQVYADAKGFVTQEWALKAKWFHMQYGQPIVLMKRKKRPNKLTARHVLP